jgi:membrane protein YqaA with SNARE-associated domain
MWKALSAKVGTILLHYGWWGLFGMSFLDSSLIPFPVVNDLALMMMASKRPAWWPFFALATTLGSVAGGYVLYGVARAGGQFYWRKAKPHAKSRAQRWLARNEFVAILVASLLPPPLPLKVFFVTAGVLRVNTVRFGLALLLGRGLRFAAEAWLGAHYGALAEAYLIHNLGWASLAAIVLIIGLALLQRQWANHGAEKSGNKTWS